VFGAVWKSVWTLVPLAEVGVQITLGWSIVTNVKAVVSPSLVDHPRSPREKMTIYMCLILAFVGSLTIFLTVLSLRVLGSTVQVGGQSPTSHIVNFGTAHKRPSQITQNLVGSRPSNLTEEERSFLSNLVVNWVYKLTTNASNTSDEIVGVRQQQLTSTPPTAVKELGEILEALKNDSMSVSRTAVQPTHLASDFKPVKVVIAAQTVTTVAATLFFVLLTVSWSIAFYYHSLLSRAARSNVPIHGPTRNVNISGWFPSPTAPMTVNLISLTALTIFWSPVCGEAGLMAIHIAMKVLDGNPAVLPSPGSRYKVMTWEVRVDMQWVHCLLLVLAICGHSIMTPRLIGSKCFRSDGRAQEDGFAGDDFSHGGYFVKRCPLTKLWSEFSSNQVIPLGSVSAPSEDSAYGDNKTSSQRRTGAQMNHTGRS
jgi:hypothetical protein